ncbi:MAG: hypothetical protein FJX35_13940 [Alphaproteobacteria bacterium]|nr:hypothetical protein [Alphaproteobacteria bacterium]
MTLGYPLHALRINEMPSVDEVAAITAAARRARARASVALFRALRRAARRKLRAVTAWLRQRIDAPVPPSPWLSRRY